MLNSSIPSCFQNLPFGQYHDGYYHPIFEAFVSGSGDTPYSFDKSLNLDSSFVPDLMDINRLHLEAEFRTKHMDYYYK
ncbi:receptor-like protein, partial [Trifolium medium]|nr:receptor-like protein [Trifolium medium]